MPADKTGVSGAQLWWTVKDFISKMREDGESVGKVAQCNLRLEYGTPGQNGAHAQKYVNPDSGTELESVRATNARETEG